MLYGRVISNAYIEKHMEKWAHTYKEGIKVDYQTIGLQWSKWSKNLKNNRESESLFETLWSTPYTQAPSSRCVVWNINSSCSPPIPETVIFLHVWTLKNSQPLSPNRALPFLRLLRLVCNRRREEHHTGHFNPRAPPTPVLSTRLHRRELAEERSEDGNRNPRVTTVSACCPPDLPQHQPVSP